ncbi:MAG TPA: RlmE family RNA methyltransferase [Thermoplasmata archaeon]|nr:RlmE family RNA methyltransferase [Thermoplasmata archaeon]
MPRDWVKGRRRDPAYRLAKRRGYRSRAAIKLAQIDDRHGLFREGDVVVDLGAAPGGWAQVARERVGPRGRVVAVDAVPMGPMEGVERVRGDFSDPSVQATLFELLRRPADVVMSDMAPHLSGARPYDGARTLDLAEAALSFAVRALRPGGTFLAKVFDGEGVRGFRTKVRARFRDVRIVKPAASAPKSSEIYVLAVDRD